MGVVVRRQLRTIIFRNIRGFIREPSIKGLGLVVPFVLGVVRVASSSNTSAYESLNYYSVRRVIASALALSNKCDGAYGQRG